jgi:DNA-binding response OmpR family regulator
MPAVLIVEDDGLILSLAEDTLTEGGFKVRTATSAEQAIKLLDIQATALRALVTDVNLGNPKLTGWDVARRAREVKPDIPVVYMTGDSAGEWTAQGVPNSVLLTKPFAPVQLLTAVSQLLNAAPPTTPRTPS